MIYIITTVSIVNCLPLNEILMKRFISYQR